MTTQTTGAETPAVSAPTTAPAAATPATTPQAQQASAPASRPTQAQKTAAIAARLAQQAPSTDDGEEGPAESDAPATSAPAGVVQPAATTTTTAPAERELSPREKHAAEVRARVTQAARERQAATQERERAAQATQPQPAAASPAQRQSMTVDDLLAQARRDPRGMAAALRDAGLDPKQVLDDLTTDSLSPGAVRAVSAAVDASTEIKRVAERVDRWEQQQQQLAQHDAYARERVAFVQAVDAAKDNYPTLAGLEPQRRIDAAMFVAERLEAQGIPYDRDLVAVETEAWLSSLAPQPAAAPAAALAPPNEQPASSPGTTTTTPAAKPKTRALPPDIAGQSGNAQPKPRSLAQRRAAISRSLDLRMRRAT